MYAAALAAITEIADLGWFERVLRPFPVRDGHNIVEDVVFERVPAAGARHIPPLPDGYSAAHGLLSSAW